MDKTVDILIPAYNEEKNIERVLLEITKQTIYPKLNKIYVVSDDSHDRTHEIVAKLINKYPKIKLRIKRHRVGKFDSMNRGFELSKADILIMLDADIHLDQNYALEELIKPMLNNTKIGLTALKNSPIISKKTYASIASLFSIYLRYEIIKLESPDNFNSFYALCGRAVALKKEIFSSAKISDDPGDDQDLFFLTITKGYRAYYVDNASISYKVPLTSKDYLKQNVRFRKTRKFKKEVYKDLVNIYTKLGYKKYLALFKAFIKHPISGIAWAPLYVYGWFSYSFTKPKEKGNGSAWEIAESTK